MKFIKNKDGDIVHGIKILKVSIPEDKRKCIFECPFCKKEKIKWRGLVLSGSVKSCGCNRFHKREWKSHCFKDLAGKKFGNLTVIERDWNKLNKVYFKCKCDCGKEKTIFAHYLKSGKSASCGCSKHFIHEKSKSWKGYKEITGHYFAHIRSQAKHRKLLFKINPKQIWNLFLKQNGKCALSGMSIKLSLETKNVGRTASLDRINNNKGYIKNNIQWVHKDINWMKRTLTEKKFIEYCHAVCRLHPE